MILGTSSTFNTEGVAGFQRSLGLGRGLELSAGLRFRGEVLDSALMSTRTVAAAVWKCARVRVERGVVRRLHKTNLHFQKFGRIFDPTKDPCLLYTSPSPRDKRQSRMPSSA